MAGGKSEGYANTGLLLSKIELKSAIVKAALNTYGTGQFRGLPASTERTITLKYILPSGLTFTRNQRGWMLGFAPPSAKTLPLRLQTASGNEFLLWDSTSDVLYLVPKNGGIVKRKSGGEVSWTDIGTATKK